MQKKRKTPKTETVKLNDKTQQVPAPKMIDLDDETLGQVTGGSGSNHTKWYEQSGWN